MKIAVATPVLYDKNSPFNHLLKDIIGGFLEAGHDVIRFVAVRDEQEDGYKYGYDDVKYRKYIRKESGHCNIVSRYIRDTVTNIREARGISRSDADVLFEDVTYSSFWAVRAAKKRGMRVVAMLQDVWPDNAVLSGLIKADGLLYKYFESWQRYVYKNADKIICISDDMKDFIVSKGVPAEKIEVIYNWGYSDEIVDLPWEENKFVEKYGLKRAFYAVYAGNIGKMQNVELVVRAASKMPDTEFLIIGDGSNREAIEKTTADMENVRLFPLQPSELAEHVYSMAGVNIIPLVDGGAKTAMPSKTGVVLSCGRPVIFCFGSRTKFGKKLEQYNAGTSVSATDENELVEAIKNVKGGKGAISLFADCFKQGSNVKKYVEALLI